MLTITTHASLGWKGFITLLVFFYMCLDGFKVTLRTKCKSIIGTWVSLEE